MERNAPVEGGGNRCDTLCCILNCSLELLCLLLILGTFFLPAFSVDVSAKNAPGTLGVCNIENPNYNSTCSEYNRVYFGWIPETTTGTISGTSPYGDVKDVPIYWRVLNTCANDTSSTPALFMLTEYTLPTGVKWGYGSSGSQKWSYTEGDINKTDSAIRKFLQGTSCKATLKSTSLYSADVDSNNNTIGFYDQCFEKPEQEAIMYTTNGERLNYYNSSNSTNYYAQEPVNCDADGADRPTFYNVSGKKSGDGTTDAGNYILCGCGLNEEKIFLLSAKEVLDTKYGFENKYAQKSLNYYLPSADVNRKAIKLPATSGSISSRSWWLRSAGTTSSTIVAFVQAGYCTCCTSGSVTIDFTEICVRCALNVPLSKIIFAQDSFASPTPSSIFTSLALNTLTRTKINYSNSTTVTAGAKLTILDDTRHFTVDNTYISTEAGSTINLHYTGASVGDGEYISAIIKQVGTKEDGTGTGIYGGDGLYHARLKEVGSNTAGNVTMTIPQDLPLGEYTLIVYNELERGAHKTNYAGYDTLMLTIKDLTNPTVTNVYRNKLGDSFKLTASDENLSHISTLEDQEIIDLSGTNTTKNFLYGKSINGINIYDISGNATTVYASDIPIDKTPPSVTVSYTNGTYNLTVSDSESGVWKITNSNGDIIYRDYSTSNSSATT